MSRLLMLYFEDVNAYGCPHCGYRSHRHWVQQGPFTNAICGECQKGFVVYCGELPMIATYNGHKTWGGAELVLERHPRHGIPKHGKGDEPPEDGGEHWWPRGIGKDWNLGCIVCGEMTGPADGLWNNVAAFVQCKTAGERVVKLFKHGARLDYRESSPDRVQVKIGACDGHKLALECLTSIGQVITQRDVDLAIETAADIAKKLSATP